MALDWKQRIRRETGMPVVDAVTLLAKRRHSQKGIAKILGVGVSTLRRYTKDFDIPWCDPLESVEYWEAKKDQAPSEKRVAHIKECHKRKTERAQHVIDGVSGTIEEHCDRLKIVSARTARRRLKEGMSVYEAVTKKPGKPKFDKSKHVWKIYG